MLMPPATQDPRLQTTLRQRHGESFCERSLIVCSGSDMVNISCTNIIFKDVATATVGWRVFSLYLLVLEKVPSEDDPEVRNHGEGPY